MVFKPTTPGGNKKQIEVSAPDETLRGLYVNHMIALHTKEEIILDFFNLFPPKGILAARVVTSPGHFKRILNNLNQTMKNYEKAFGVVTEAEAPGEHKGYSE